MRRLVLPLAAAALAACHDYTPLAGQAPKPDSNVRVTLTDSGSMALSGYLGPKIVAVRGKYLGKTDSGGVKLAVSGTESTSESLPREWGGEQVELPRFAVATMERQKIAMLPTIGVAAGAAVLLGGAFTALSGNGFYGAGGGAGHPGGTKH
jgi:hypothetical protein